MTSTSNIYWNNNGKYQQQYNYLELFIPFVGTCDNNNLELLRVACNAYYDIYNNGGCNVHRFKELYEQLNNNKNYFDTASFSKEEWQKLSNFIEYSSNESEYYNFERDEYESNRANYLFDFQNLDDDEKIILNLFEKLLDEIILLAAILLAAPSNNIN